ncbi:PH domain-containing protein [Neobacillus sp. FSL H8-0543]|uniref:PH domain-containing protein n=1 Tax=Neobacillus sp. FSL H8-0543 TaxID=2954672 RepID=UPI00315808C5
MFEPKRLHPIFIVINIGKRIKDLLFTFIALFFIGNKGNGGWIFLLGAAAIAVTVIIVMSVFSWLRYTYRLEQGELRIEYGVFVRKKRYIPFERIQSLDISEGLLQRMFGMVKLQIETAGGSGQDEAEAVLAAISKEEARIIQEYVAAAKQSTPRASDNLEAAIDSQTVYKITPSQLIVLSLTSGGVGVVISAVLAFLSQIDDLIPYGKIFRGIETWIVSNTIIVIAVMIFIGLLLAWIIALIGTMLKYANFTVTKTEHDLVISQGLLERRQITIPLKRIQAIRINENIVRQLLGLGTVFVESAGGSAKNQEGSKVMLLPLVKMNQIAPILEPFITDYQLNNSFTPVPERARVRYLFRNSYWTIPIVLASLFFWKVWGLLSLILLGMVLIWAVMEYKDAGWIISGQQLSLRYRTIVRTTVHMKKNKIQSLDIRESYFQKKKNLATIEAFVKVGFGGSGGKVLDLEQNDVKKVYSWYSRK